MKKFLLRTLKIIAIIYIVICILLYFFQEKIIFVPEKLDPAYAFHFDQPFEEKSIPAADGTLLNGLLFKADSSKGLIFYLHGNAGSLSSWGKVAKTYTGLGYDVFMLDYRGYGKSGGKVSGQEELFNDLQTAYNEMKRSYPENKIIVLGYSIGTGMAAKTASENNPRLLILQAPYYSLTDMMRQRYPVIPTFLLRYKFATNEYLKKCRMPVLIFHGDKDEVIDYSASLKLKDEFKAGDTLVTLKGQRHNGMSDNEEYRKAITVLLNDQ